jgi:hypothetical protein
MLSWLLCFQVATTCFSRSPPGLKLALSVTSFIFLLHVKWSLPPGDSPIAVDYYYYYYYYKTCLQIDPNDITTSIMSWYTRGFQRCSYGIYKASPPCFLVSWATGRVRPAFTKVWRDAERGGGREKCRI